MSDHQCWFHKREGPLWASAVVGEDPDDVRAVVDLLIDVLQRVGGAQLGLMFARERVEGGQVLLGGLEQLADLRRDRAEPLQHAADALFGQLGALGLEDLFMGASDQAALIATAGQAHVAGEVPLMPTSA